MGSLFGGGGSTQAPNPPAPLHLDVNKLEKQMVAADQAYYGAEDAYMNQYYPDLVKARDSMIQQAYANLTGPLNPSLENTFVNQANMGAANALGGGDQSFGLGTGSLARNQAAASIASNEQGYQDYNRSLFESLNQMYAPRSYGMTPEDAANIFTFNNTQYNNYLQQKYAGATQAYYQNQAQSAGQTGAILGTLGSLAAAGITAA